MWLKKNPIFVQDPLNYLKLEKYEVDYFEKFCAKQTKMCVLSLSHTVYGVCFKQIPNEEKLQGNIVKVLWSLRRF